MIEKDEVKQKFLKLHSQGYTDKELSEFFDVGRHAVINWRNRFDLEPNKAVGICELCGKEYEKSVSHQKYCRECREKKNYSGVKRHYTITDIRKSLWEMINRGDEMLAEHMISKMIEDEGRDFAREAIGKELYAKIIGNEEISGDILSAMRLDGDSRCVSTESKNESASSSDVNTLAKDGHGNSFEASDVLLAKQSERCSDDLGKDEDGIEVLENKIKNVNIELKEQRRVINIVVHMIVSLNKIVESGRDTEEKIEVIDSELKRVAKKILKIVEQT